MAKIGMMDNAYFVGASDDRSLGAGRGARDPSGGRASGPLSLGRGRASAPREGPCGPCRVSMQ